jgi:isopentenyldiphosphate isomerase
MKRPSDRPKERRQRGNLAPKMTMATAAELVDVYDDAGRHLGTRLRAQVHRDGAWHYCFHCLILSGPPDQLSFVLQRRGREVGDYPGLIDVTAAGHLRAGEAMPDAVRELHEELGLSTRFEELEPLGCYPLVVSGPGLLSREWTEVFVLRDERPLTTYVCNPGEVDAVLAIPVASARALWRGKIAETTAFECARGHEPRRIAVRAEDFVNDVPEYWHFVADAVVQRFGIAPAPGHAR